MDYDVALRLQNIENIKVKSNKVIPLQNFQGLYQNSRAPFLRPGTPKPPYSFT